MLDKNLAPFQYMWNDEQQPVQILVYQAASGVSAKGTVIVMDNASFHSKKRLFSAAQMPGVDFCFCLPIPRNLTPLKIFGLGLNAFYVKFFPLPLRLLMLFLLFFNCGDHNCK